MKFMDNVEVIVEKKEYAEEGVHKGMHGWITEPETIDGTWLVSFPQCYEKDNIATIPVKEVDMMVVRILDARVNEQTKVAHEKAASCAKNDSNGLSEYFV